MDVVASSFSNSDVPNLCKYDIFVSFRGEDTRMNFTSHLYAALCRKKITAYIDEQNLDQGNEISPSLFKAIEDSKLSVIIFSKDYASSTWCLDELVHILKCNKERGQIVIPVFYDVDPSHVRKQKETYAAAFVEHEKRFKDEMDKVKAWRDALTTAANLSGFDSRTWYESKLVDRIVEYVLRKLNTGSSRVSSRDDFKDFVGINKRLGKIEKMLSIDSPNIRIVGIWGMGGIGKTTLADIMFNRLFSEFEASCFLANVREESEKHGLINLQNKLLAKLLEEDSKSLDTPSLRLTFAKQRLHRKKVLVVLDDVESSNQLECLIGDKDQFGAESKIIITTRDGHVLQKVADEIYEVEELDFDEALELFYLNAFKRGCSKESFVELSKRVVSYTKGNPLALKVLGSFLHSRTKEEWQSALNKLKIIPHPEILKVLRISYDGLDDVEKDIFLDIACFFKGENRNFIERILDGCNFFPKIGIKVLIDKSLITVKGSGEIVWMHDLVQEMGWEIVRQQSTKDPKKRNRLWIAQDVYNVLKNNRGTEALEGIYLDLSKLDEDLQLRPTAFQEMHNLRLLRIYSSNHKYIKHCKVHLIQGIKFLPHSLRYLSWYEYPWKSLPSNFIAENLVELDMPHSELKQLWSGVQYLGNLKHINLRWSKHLIKIPDLSQAPKLESINLENCTSLPEVPPLNFQISYQHKSSNLYFFKKALGCLTLLRCTSFKTLSKVSGNIILLDLSSTAIEELPSSIVSLENLVYLNLSSCKYLENIPKLPRNIEILNLSRTKIKQVPTSIECLHRIKEINLQRCQSLESLPINICKLKSLEVLNLYFCSRLKQFTETFSLEQEDIQQLSTAKASNKNLFGLRRFDMSYCKNLEFVLNCIFDLSHLTGISLRGCLKIKLDNFESRSLCLFALTDLDMSYCNILEIPDWLGLLSSLTDLNIGGNLFDSIPPSITQLRQLRELDIRNCKNLRSLPELPLSIQFVSACGCCSLETVSDFAECFSRDSTHIDIKEFWFSECLKLDQDSRNNLTKFLYEVEKRYPAPIVTLCYPGSEIPKCFSHQSENSSITIKLPPDWLNANFFGFALCFVATFEGFSCSTCEWLQVKCDLHLKTHHGHCEEDSTYWSFEIKNFASSEEGDHQKFASSDHVFMMNYKCHVKCFADVLFDFIVVDPCCKCRLDQWDFRVKRCGVSMLHLQEAKELGAINDESKPKRSEIINSDTNERQCKRIRRSKSL